jgi:hypothetical protein
MSGPGGVATVVEISGEGPTPMQAFKVEFIAYVVKQRFVEEADRARKITVFSNGVTVTEILNKDIGPVNLSGLDS